MLEFLPPHSFESSTHFGDVGIVYLQVIQAPIQQKHLIDFTSSFGISSYIESAGLGLANLPTYQLITRYTTLQNSFPIVDSSRGCPF